MVAEQRSVRVVAAVVERDGRYLVARRPPHHRHGGLWEFPGGKVEPGESDQQATARELREELAVQVLDVGPIVAHHADPGTAFVIVFRRTDIEGDPQAIEHSALAWCTVEELRRLQMAPSDTRFVAGLAGATHNGT